MKKIKVFTISRLYIHIVFDTEGFEMTTSQGYKQKTWVLIGPVQRDDMRAFHIVVGPITLSFALLT